MYTFQPLATIPVDHAGFGLIVFMSIILVIVFTCIEGWVSFFIWFFFATISCGIAYGVSYHWSNQEPRTFANTEMVGKLVGFTAEGYATDERSGKQTHRVEHHNTYVIYEVDNRRIMLDAKVGNSFPDRVILYKN